MHFKNKERMNLIWRINSPSKELNNEFTHFICIHFWRQGNNICNIVKENRTIAKFWHFHYIALKTYVDRTRTTILELLKVPYLGTSISTLNFGSTYLAMVNF